MTEPRKETPLESTHRQHRFALLVQAGKLEPVESFLRERPYSSERYSVAMVASYYTGALAKGRLEMAELLLRSRFPVRELIQGGELFSKKALAWYIRHTEAPRLSGWGIDQILRRLLKHGYLYEARRLLPRVPGRELSNRTWNRLGLALLLYTLIPDQEEHRPARYRWPMVKRRKDIEAQLSLELPPRLVGYVLQAI